MGKGVAIVVVGVVVLVGLVFVAWLCARWVWVRAIRAARWEPYRVLGEDSEPDGTPRVVVLVRLVSRRWWGVRVVKTRVVGVVPVREVGDPVLLEMEARAVVEAETRNAVGSW